MIFARREKKLFTSDKVTLMWLSNKKFLSIGGKDEREVTYLVLSQLCGEPKDDRCTNKAQKETVAIQRVQCNDLAQECEGTKLELVILQSQVNKRIQENAYNIAKLKREFSNIVKPLACKNQEKLSSDSREYSECTRGVQINNLLDLCNALQTDVRNHKEDLETTLHFSQIKLSSLNYLHLLNPLKVKWKDKIFLWDSLQQLKLKVKTIEQIIHYKSNHL